MLAILLRPLAYRGGLRRNGKGHNNTLPSKVISMSPKMIHRQSELISRFKKHLQNENILKPGDNILIACSGGPDSVALAHLFSDLAPVWKWRLALAYFHHGLRNAADRDLEFVKKLAAKLKIPFYSGRGKVLKAAKSNRESVEEAARRLRYDFLEQTARRHGLKKVVLAHTLDDQAETILMRILQGTGLRGLGGIRTVILKNKILFYRPLLSFSKKDLLAELCARKVSFRIDLSNRSVRFLRNRIRHDLMPHLAKYFNPRIQEALVRLQANLEKDFEALDYAESLAWKQTLISKNKKSVRFKRSEFEALPNSLQFRILSKGIQGIHPRSGIDYKAWHRIRAALKKSSTQMDLSGALRLQILPSEIRIKT